MAYRTKKTLKTLALAGTAMALIAYGPAAAQETKKIEFDIEAQELGDALNEFGVQSGKEVYYLEADIAGKQTKGVEGVYSADEAINLLLNSTGIPHSDNGSGTILIGEAYIQRASLGEETRPEPFRVAQLDQEEGVRGVSRDDGEDELRVEDTIVVTGTNIRGIAPVGSQPLTIDSADIEKSGFASVDEILQSLPQSIGAVPGGDTIQVGTPENGGNVGFGSGINLRGLGADATLVLLNGRRLTGSGASGEFVDVSSIPPTAIERIEVLADGASALYGADAIGGVVNIVMRDDFEGVETTARFGTVTDGGLNEYRASQVIGFNWRTGSVLGTYEYYKRDNLLAADRRFSANSDLTQFGGDDFGIDFSNPGNVFNLSPFEPAFAIPSGQDGTSLEPDDFIAGQVNIQNRREGTDILPQTERHSAYFSIKQELTSQIEMFGEARFSRREFESATGANSGFLSVTPNNPFFATPTPGSTRTLVAYSFIDDLGPLKTSGDVERYGFVGGASVDFGTSWSGELFGTYNREVANNRSVGIPNSLLVREALGNFSDPDTGSLDNPETDYNPFVDGFLNPFGDGSVNAPAIVDAIRGFSTDENITELWSVNFKADGRILTLPGGDVRLAIGGEYREERLDRDATNFVRTAAPVPGSAANFGRRVVAGFGELYIPIFGEQNRKPGFESLDVSIAGRLEDYDDFGTTANPKVGVAWAPVNGLTLHGTYGTSFRAASLPEIDTSSFRIRRTILTDPLSPTGRTNVIFLAGGNGDLEPEEATAFTLGALVEPPAIPRLRFEVGYFDIDFADRIAAPGIENIVTVLQQEDTFAPFIVRDPDILTVTDLLNDPAYTSSPIAPEAVGAIIDGRFVNTGSTNVSGFDISAAYGFSVGSGQLDLRTSASYVIEFEEKLTPTAPSFDFVDTIFNPVDLRIRSEVGWSNEALSTSLFVNYTDGYTDNASSPERKVESWTTFDLSLAYDFASRDDLLKNLSVRLNVQNVFDQDPPFVNNSAGVAFDPNNSNPLGRFISVQLRKNW